MKIIAETLFIRSPAKKTNVFEIINGKYFGGSKEEMKPGYVIIHTGERISRVNVCGSLTEKFVSDDSSHASVTLDDGSAAIKVRVFKEDVEKFSKVEPGDLVLVIGKIKNYNGENYINGEVIRHINPNEEILRKLEVLQKLVEKKKMTDEIKEIYDKSSLEELREYVKNKFHIDEEALNVLIEGFKVRKEIDYKPKLLHLIETLDDGKGVEMRKIFELSQLSENVIEKTLNELIDDGSVYEPLPGILKKV